MYRALVLLFLAVPLGRAVALGHPWTIPELRVPSTPSPAPCPEAVTRENFFSWTGADLMARAGTTFTARIEGYASLPQSLTRLSDWPEPSRRLGALLQARSRRRRYVNSVDRIEAVLNRQIMMVELRRLGVGEDALRSTAERLMAFDAVEIAAWVVRLRDGTVRVAVHTSRRNDGTLTSDTASAWNGLLSRGGCAAEEIERIDWWHTHPGEAPSVALLSGEDEQFARSFRAALDARGGNRVPFSLHAIHRRGAQEPLVTSVTP